MYQPPQPGIFVLPPPAPPVTKIGGGEHQTLMLDGIEGATGLNLSEETGCTIFILLWIIKESWPGAPCPEGNPPVIMGGK